MAFNKCQRHTLLETPIQGLYMLQSVQNYSLLFLQGNMLLHDLFGLYL